MSQIFSIFQFKIINYFKLKKKFKICICCGFIHEPQNSIAQYETDYYIVFTNAAVFKQFNVVACNKSLWVTKGRN